MNMCLRYYLLLSVIVLFYPRVWCILYCLEGLFVCFVMVTGVSASCVLHDGLLCVFVMVTGGSASCVLYRLNVLFYVRSFLVLVLYFLDGLFCPGLCLLSTYALCASIAIYQDQSIFRGVWEGGLVSSNGSTYPSLGFVKSRFHLSLTDSKIATLNCSYCYLNLSLHSL